MFASDAGNVPLRFVLAKLICVMAPPVHVMPWNVQYSVVVLLAAVDQPTVALHAHPAVATNKSLSARHTVALLLGAQASEKLPHVGIWQALVSVLQEPPK